MQTAEVARQAEVNPQTLRYYERRGLLPDPGRSGSGYRRYGPEAAMRDCLERLVATCPRPPALRECPLLEVLGEDAAR